MPAIARVPISHVEFDPQTGLAKPVLTYAAGAHIPDADVALLAASNRHAMIVIPHNEHTCPDDCPDESHAPPPAAPPPPSARASMAQAVTKTPSAEEAK